VPTIGEARAGVVAAKRLARIIRAASASVNRRPDGAEAFHAGPKEPGSQARLEFAALGQPVAGISLKPAQCKHQNQGKGWHVQVIGFSSDDLRFDKAWHVQGLSTRRQPDQASASGRAYGA
jgi:hypothetical protein